MKTFFLFPLLLLSVNFLFAQEDSCYKYLKRKGDTQNSQGNYKEAILYYLGTLSCLDRPSPREDPIPDLIEQALQAREDQLDSARVEAEAGKKKADNASLEAQIAATEAEQALAEKQIAVSQILAFILLDAQSDILHLNYEAAQQKYRNAAALKVDGPKVGAGMMEIGYFYLESHQFERALPLMDIIYQLYGQKTNYELESNADTLAILRTALRDLDPTRYQALRIRYYPEMMVVPGGQLKRRYMTVLVDSFEIAKTETTNWQYHLFMETTKYNNPEYLDVDWKELGLGNYPAVSINWYDGLIYANWLSKQLNLGVAYTIDSTQVDPSNQSKIDRQKWFVTQDITSSGFRLPTEAEWEFAANGRTTDGNFTLYSGGNDLDIVGWYIENSRSHPHPVGTKRPNKLGLQDMSGNVWEWCWDWYDRYDIHDLDNPKGPSEGYARLMRGGSWLSNAGDCQVRQRRRLGNLGMRAQGIGLRLARSIKNGK